MKKEFEVCDFCEYEREGLKELIVPLPEIIKVNESEPIYVPGKGPVRRLICLRCYRKIEQKYYEFEKELKGELKHE